MAKEALLATIAEALGSFYYTSTKLADSIFKPFSRFCKPSATQYEELENLKSKLGRIQATLKDAEELAISDFSVQLWLRELRDLEANARDVVEEAEFKLANKFEEFKAELLRLGSNKRKREASFCRFSRSKNSLSCKMKKIEGRFEEIASDRVRLALTEEDGLRVSKISQLSPTSSFFKGKLLGRDMDLEKVIGMVLSDEESPENKYSVISIFGMAGVGKTSLVQRISHDQRVVTKFGPPIWVQVPQKIDVMHLTRQIAQEIHRGSCESFELNLLHSIIVEHVKQKRILLVLDDVWGEENKEPLENLLVPLSNGMPGSKIIVTTRNQRVAKLMCQNIYGLNCLSDEDCWSVCQKCIENSKPNFDCNLIPIGEAITKKCKGLPLAAKAVGGVLLQSMEEKHWMDVLENYLWEDRDTFGRILPALKVSFDYLPMPLKRCFAYCSLFPKDHVFRRDQTVELWVAQGFIDESELSPRIEHVGRKYFDDLVAMCFFQLSPFHDVTEGSYKMHDLYHELTRHVSYKECLRIENCMFSCNNDHARHSSLVPLETHCKELMEFSSFNGEYLRTFLFIGNMEYKSDGTPFCMKIPNDLFLNLLCLRALDLSNTDVKELPDSIGNLIHLRYLGLENTKIVSLPETISYFFKLLVMNLSNCNNLVELPKGIKLLSNLRHLNLPINGNPNMRMPRGMGQLTGLQSLRIFIVTDDSGCRIQELKNLNNLSGELSIRGINNVTNVQFASDANLRNKNKLQKLTLQWSHVESPNTDLASDVLEVLQPQPHLKELVINGFIGNQFPSWLGDEWLKLVILDLKDCVNTTQLPSLGRLPCLKHLGICSMPSVTRIGREFCSSIDESSSSSNGANSKGFPVLETLKFRKMNGWEEWCGVSIGDFSRLKYLVLDGCPKLRELTQINSLLYLRVHDCEELRDIPFLPSIKSFMKDNRIENRENTSPRHNCCCLDESIARRSMDGS